MITPSTSMVGDVLAARDDDVLGAVAQLDIAVLVQDAEIAGMEPAVIERPPSSPWRS
jgi:hypothetical protein